MKFFRLIPILFLISCATNKPAEQRIAPSTDKVKTAFSQSFASANRAGANIDSINTSSRRIDERLRRSQDYAERIDNKATVILRYWK